VEKEGGDQFIEVTVTEPQKLGEGIGSYVAYKVITRTNMPIFRKRSFSVMRRFSDFLGLHDKLVEKYLRMGRIIPPAPEKSVIGKWYNNTRARLTFLNFFSFDTIMKVVSPFVNISAHSHGKIRSCQILCL